MQPHIVSDCLNSFNKHVNIANIVNIFSNVSRSPETPGFLRSKKYFDIHEFLDPRTLSKLSKVLILNNRKDCTSLIYCIFFCWYFSIYIDLLSSLSLTLSSVTQNIDEVSLSLLDQLFVVTGRLKKYKPTKLTN